MKNWKKVCAAVVAVSICAVGMPFYASQNVLPGTAIVASAESYVYENLTYDYLEDGTIEITGCDDAATELVIPSEINGTAVTSIGEYAFSDNTNLTSVMLPEGMTTIKEEAFSGCTGLTEITIPDGVTTLGDDAFYGCSNLEFITIPESVVDFGFLTFSQTAWMTAKRAENPLVIVNNVLIDGNACSNDVIIPDGVTRIAACAFWGNDYITSVTIPDSVRFIGEYSLSYCWSLTELNIPDSVEVFEDCAISGSRMLSNITVSENNPALSVEDGVLFNKDKTKLIACPCTKEGTYSIPDSVTTIAESAFMANNLTEIYIPDSVTDIGSTAFSSNFNLTGIIVSEDNPAYTSVDGILFNKELSELICYPSQNAGAYVIPDSVTKIAEDAFAYCSNLESVTIPDSVTEIGMAAFAGCSGLTEITIPDSITSIEMWTFGSCSNLTTVTIPSSVTYIDLMAFYNNKSLTDVYFTGSEDEWNAITIDSGNDYLKEAAIHFEGTPGTSVTTTATTTSETTETTASASTDTTDTTTASDSTDTTTTASSETTTTTASTETTASTSTEVTTTTTENNTDDYFASVDEMCEMAIKDYEQKHGVLAENAEATVNEDGTLTIELTDASGEVLETYTIDPVTGTGTASDGCEVNLPQTGNNSMGTMMKATGAALLAFGGLFAMMKSGIFGKRKKEDA